MKKIVILFLSIFFSTVIIAQEVILDENPQSLYQPKKWGQNRTNFIHLFGSYAWVIGLPEGDAYDLKYGFSRDWKFGARYKLKLNNHFDIGADINISNSRYRFAQYGSNIFPDSTMHDKEYLSFSAFGMDYFNRINFGKRGDKIGKYFDFGLYGTINYLARHNYWDKLSTPYSGSTKVKTTLYNLNYIADINWGLKAKIGYGRVAFWSSYRLSNLFNSKLNSSNSIELPRTIVGIEIGFF